MPIAAIILAVAAAICMAAGIAGTPRGRIMLLYLWRHHRWPDLGHPARFTEWVQWRKLHDRDHGLAMLTDKLHAKAFAAGCIDPHMIIPTLWQGLHLPPAPPGPMPFIVKANHGCGQFVVVRNAADWEHAQRVAPGWLARPYGLWLDEWHYTQARRMLLAEPFIGPADALPIDYKVYVFNGIARCIQVHMGRASDHIWMQFDRDWTLLSTSAAPVAIAQPVSLKAMLLAAEAIGAGRDHLRVDFYEVAGEPRFGEVCLFPGSGLDPFHPTSLDTLLGGYWRGVPG